jgi:hypothetical protein
MMSKMTHLIAGAPLSVGMGVASAGEALPILGTTECKGDGASHHRKETVSGQRQNY